MLTQRQLATTHTTTRRTEGGRESVCVDTHAAARGVLRIKRKGYMRAVVQRVKSASVTVDGNVVSSIGPGLMVLVGWGTVQSNHPARSQ